MAIKRYYFNVEKLTFIPCDEQAYYPNIDFSHLKIVDETTFQNIINGEGVRSADENGYPILIPYPPHDFYDWNQEKKTWEISSENLDKLFKQKKTALILRLKDKTEEFGATLTWEYPQCERDTFPIQKEEALKFKQGKTDDLRCLPGIAEKRNLELSVLADKVLQKTLTFEYVSGLLTGERQKFMDKLNTATTVEQLEQIEQEIESWVFAVS